jgi:lysophospholipase L1-like esterase
MIRSPLWLVAFGCAAVLAVAALVITRLRDDRDEIERESIVLLGDSITAQGDWPVLLAGWPVVNRGFPGFTSAEIASVTGEVGSARPRAVFVLAGTNDIRDDRDTAWTAVNLVEIIDTVRTESSDTVIVLQTLLPRSDRPEAVDGANEAIARVATEHGLFVLDLHGPFVDGSGGLRPSETTDGVHLSDAGYRRWAALLDQALRDLFGPPGSGPR